MTWKHSDYGKAEGYIEKLDKEERRLNTLLAQVTLLKHGVYQIKGKRTVIVDDDTSSKEIILVPPNDLSGGPMKDDYRLEQLKNIITKTDKLLNK